MYNLLKFLHVASIIVWIGGMIMLVVLNRIFARAGDQSTIRALGQAGGKFSVTFFMPAAVVALITGVGMVQVAHYGFGRPWILYGLIGLFLSFVIGGGISGRNAKKLGQLMATGQIDAAGAARLQRIIITGALVNMLLLLSIVAVMVFKP